MPSSEMPEEEENKNESYEKFAKMTKNAFDRFRTEGHLLLPFILRRVGGSFEPGDSLESREGAENAVPNKLQILPVSITRWRKCALDFQRTRKASKGAVSDVLEATDVSESCSYAVERKKSPKKTNR